MSSLFPTWATEAPKRHQARGHAASRGWVGSGGQGARGGHCAVWEGAHCAQGQAGPAGRRDRTGLWGHQWVSEVARLTEARAGFSRGCPSWTSGRTGPSCLAVASAATTARPPGLPGTPSPEQARAYLVLVPAWPGTAEVESGHKPGSGGFCSGFRASEGPPWRPPSLGSRGLPQGLSLASVPSACHLVAKSGTGGRDTKMAVRAQPLPGQTPDTRASCRRPPGTQQGHFTPRVLFHSP